MGSLSHFAELPETTRQMLLALSSAERTMAYQRDKGEYWSPQKTADMFVIITAEELIEYCTLVQIARRENRGVLEGVNPYDGKGQDNNSYHSWTTDFLGCIERDSGNLEALQLLPDPVKVGNFSRL